MPQLKQKKFAWIWLLIAIFFAKELLWAYLTPPWQAPDELAHYGYVESLHFDNSFPVLGQTELSERVQAIGPQPTPNMVEDYKPTLTLNWIAQHPPLYYLILQPVFAMLPHGDVMTSILLLRLFSIVLGCVTLWYASKTLRLLLPKQDLMQLAIVTGMAFLPMFSSISALMNNDNLVFALSSVLLFVSVSNFEKESMRGSVFMGLLLGLLALTKATALPLFMAVFIIETWKHLRMKKHWPARLKTLLKHHSIIFGTAALIAGWWYVRNYVLYHAWIPELADVVRIHPELLTNYPNLPVIFPELSPATAAKGLTAYDFFIKNNFFIEYYKNIWGAFGQFFFRLADWQYMVIYVITGLSFIGYLWNAVKSFMTKKWPTEKEMSAIILDWKGVLVWAPLVSVMVPLAWKLLQIFEGRGFLGALQGRYVFSALLPFMFILMKGFDHLLPAKWKKHVWVLLMMFFVCNDFFALTHIIIPEFY